jgi:uncharacterized membrane protein
MSSFKIQLKFFSTLNQYYVNIVPLYLVISSSPNTSLRTYIYIYIYVCVYIVSNNTPLQLYLIKTGYLDKIGIFVDLHLPANLQLIAAFSSTLINNSLLDVFG